jgi:flagellar biosynthesis GTPase FlhF
MLTPQQHKVFQGAVGYAGKMEHWTQLANELDVPVGTVQKIWDEARRAILEEILPQTRNMTPDQLMETVGLPKPVADAICDQELRRNRNEAQETQQTQGRQYPQQRQQAQYSQQRQQGQRTQQRQQAQYLQQKQQTQQARQTQQRQQAQQAQETQHNQQRPVSSPQFQRSHLAGQPGVTPGQSGEQARPMRQAR